MGGGGWGGMAPLTIYIALPLSVVILRTKIWLLSSLSLLLLLYYSFNLYFEQKLKCYTFEVWSWTILCIGWTRNFLLTWILVSYNFIMLHLLNHYPIILACLPCCISSFPKMPQTNYNTPKNKDTCEHVTRRSSLYHHEDMSQGLCRKYQVNTDK